MFDIHDISPEDIKACFPAATPLSNIRQHWPALRQALVDFGLDNKLMVCMALATIRAETEGFAPISELPSQYNTAQGGPPFGLYDSRADIGNTRPGDGAAYRGRGFIQLTGKTNYSSIGQRLGVDLLHEPERANEPEIAASILALFLLDRHKPIHQALRVGDLPLARKLVNGGSHGLSRFTETFSKAMSKFPNE